MLQEIGHTARISPISLRSLEEATSRQESRVSRLRGDGSLEEHQGYPNIPLDQVVFILVASFRGHGHINNVLTHISRGNWDRIEQALRHIFDSSTVSHDLSQLERNIVELMCADRGVTGRILKPFYQELIVTILGKTTASRLIAHVNSLFLECENAVQPAAPSSVSGSTTVSNGEAH